MRWLIDVSLKSRLVVIALAAVVTVVGVVQVRAMPIDVLPEFAPLQVEIQTEALGLSTVEVEALITSPMEENLLNGLAFLEDIRSTSVPGLSSIELTFEPGTDPYVARQIVAERLVKARSLLPNVSRPPQMLQPLSASSRVLMIGLSSKDVSLIDMSVLARWTIRPALLGVPGVANVAVWGQRERQLQVLVDPVQLRDVGVSLDQVISSTGNALWVSPLSFLAASSPGTGGFIDTPNQRVGVQHVLPIATPEDLANVAVEMPTGVPGTGRRLRLGDVATVVVDHQPLIGDAVLDEPGLVLVIEKFPEANAVEVTEGVEDALAELAPGLSGIDVDTTMFRPATYIENSIENVSFALLAGFALLVALLVGLLLGWRAALVCVVSIVVSLAAGGLILSTAGVSLNAMVAAGMVLAVIAVADDSISTVDSIRTRFRGDASSEGASLSRAATVGDATVAVRSLSVYALVVILLALVPVLALNGRAGAFLPPLALAFVVATAASTVVALTVTPALAVLVLGPSRKLAGAPLRRWISPPYERALEVTTRRRRWVVLALVALPSFALVVVPLVERSESIVPEFRDSDVLITLEAHSGTSLTEMNRITERAAAELRSVPGVRRVSAHVGRAVLSDQVVGVNSAEIWVSTDPGSGNKSALAAVESIVDGYPGLEHEMVTYQRDRIDAEFAGGDGDAATVRLYGRDPGVLAAKAEEVRDAMVGIDGVVEPRVEMPPDEASVEVEVDLAAAQASAIKPGDVRRYAAALMSGIEVGSLFEDQKVFEVVVIGAEHTRHSAHDVSEMLLDTPEGGHVRLGDVADVRVSPNPTAIHHEAATQSLAVTARISGRDRDDVLADIDARLASVEFPLEHHARLIDHAEHRDADRWRFLGLVAASAMLILFLLQAAFSSWRAAFATMAVIPGALAGGLLATAIDSDAVSVGTIAGFFAVFALTVRHALILIDSCRTRSPGERSSTRSDVLRIARERFFPTIGVAAAVAVVVLPSVVLGDRAGLEIVHPMAVVILGGVITSSLLIVLVLPALILALGIHTETPRHGGEPI